MRNSPDLSVWLSYMEEAVEEARQGISAAHGGPFGALIIENGAVLSRAHNEVLHTHDPSAHAEVLAIRRACTVRKKPHLPEAVLVSSCEPCPMCLATALWARIPLVLFGCTRHDAAAIGFDDSLFHQQLVWTPDAVNPLLELKNLGRELCLPLFDLWANVYGERMY